MVRGMQQGMRMRAAFIGGFLVLVVVCAVGIWRVGYIRALDQLAAQGQADLALASDRVAGQLQRYRELAVLMSDHPVLTQLSTGHEPLAARRLFQSVADKTSALDVMYMDIDGFVRAAARGAELRNLSDLPFAQRALQGALGTGMATYFPLPERAYYFAAPQFGPGGRVVGAVVVAADIAEIEWDWTGSNPAVFFTDQSGVVRITNRSELAGWFRPDTGTGLNPPKGPAQPVSARYDAGHEIWRTAWSPYLPDRALHIIRDLPVFSLRAEALLDTRPALRIAGLQAAAFAGLCLAFGAILLTVTDRRRALAEANTRLEARVAARTEALSASNAALLRENRERKEAEAALRQAQADLVQAGKLSALGQMSAGISHELNQPLMAIRSFAENAATYLDTDRPDAAKDNVTRVADLADRMGRIIRNLRAFARQESAPVSRVDLTEVLRSAVELTEPQCRQQGVTVHLSSPDGPIWVQGGEVRLSQVFVNLISNAVDAMAGRDERRVSIEVHDADQLCVVVRDSGPGIDVPDKVFEPFYSTKSGEETAGMGLGLSISYGIVQSFGGTIRGENRSEGGAEFTVALERWSDVQEAAE